MKNFYLYTLLSLFILSCSKDEEPTLEEPEPIKKYWSISHSGKTVSFEQTELKLNIESNIEWKVLSKPDWLEVEPEAGSGNGEILLLIDENPENTFREANIIFETKIERFKFKIKQESKSLKLVSYSGQEGPLQFSKPFYFLFNKPIKVNYIRFVGDDYTLKINKDLFEYFDNGHGIRFPGGIPTLGEERSYSFSVTDEDGIMLNGTKNMNSYSQKFIIPGFIKDVILDDRKNLWVLSVQTFLQNEPSYIIKYKIENRSLIEDLRFEVGIDGSDEYSYKPGAFCINPFNDLIYVTNPLQNKIEVYTKSGNLVKEISKEGLTITDAIVFLRSGLGIFTGQLDNNGRWLFIDSAKNDEIYLPRSHPYFYFSPKTVALNYDKTKAYLIENRSPIFKVFNQSGDFHEINMKDAYPNGADAVHITPNKTNSEIYVAGLYNQQIIKPDFSFVGNQSYLKFFLGDFSYDPDYSNQIYGLYGASGNNVRFKLLDFNNQQTTIDYPINFNFSLGGYPGVITSPDNDVIILYTDRYDSTSKRSQIIVFDTEMFK